MTAVLDLSTVIAEPSNMALLGTLYKKKKYICIAKVFVLHFFSTIKICQLFGKQRIFEVLSKPTDQKAPSYYFKGVLDQQYLHSDSSEQKLYSLS